MPRKSKKYELSMYRIKFDIAVTFPEGDVDVVLANLAQWVPFHHDVKGKSTPIEITVEKYLAILMHESINNKIFGKAEVCGSYSLMQNFCSLTFEVDADDLKDMSELQEIINNCEKIMRSYAKIIRYYKDKTTVGHSMGVIGACG